MGTQFSIWKKFNITEKICIKKKYWNFKEEDNFNLFSHSCSFKKVLYSHTVEKASISYPTLSITFWIDIPLEIEIDIIFFYYKWIVIIGYCVMAHFIKFQALHCLTHLQKKQRNFQVCYLHAHGLNYKWRK